MLSTYESERVLTMIDEKISELISNGDSSKESYDKKLGYLTGLREILLENM